MNKIFRKDMDYFWEIKYPFGEFLKEIFENQYKRKYSLTGNGIYNLLYINNKIYEIKLTETKTLLKNDNSLFRDDKGYIIENITKNLDTEFTVSGGKFITFKVGPWKAKIEIIKKIKEPT